MQNPVMITCHESWLWLIYFSALESYHHLWKSGGTLLKLQKQHPDKTRDMWTDLSSNFKQQQKTPNYIKQEFSDTRQQAV